MNCPAEIEHALLEILRVGILQVRSSGWDGDAQRCVIESDHIHNLPHVLDQFSFEALRYYYDVERRVYVATGPAGAARSFERHWEVLAEFLHHEPVS